MLGGHEWFLLVVGLRSVQPAMFPNNADSTESGSTMRIVRTFFTYFIIVLSVLGIGSYPPIM